MGLTFVLVMANTPLGHSVVIVNELTQAVYFQYLVIVVIVVIAKKETQQNIGDFPFCFLWIIFPTHFLRKKCTMTTMTTMTAIDYQSLKKYFAMTRRYDHKRFAMTKGNYGLD